MSNEMDKTLVWNLENAIFIKLCMKTNLFVALKGNNPYENV